MRWARCRLMPSPAASVATSTRTWGSDLKSSCAFALSSRPMPPWMHTTASGRPSKVLIRSARYARVSLCSEKITSFSCGDGVGRGISPAPYGGVSSAIRLAMAAGVNISCSKLASSRHLRSSPLSRTCRASDSRCSKTPISVSSSSIVRAAVAWSSTCSSTSSISISGASSRSSTSSGSSMGPSGASAAAARVAPRRSSLSSRRRLSSLSRRRRKD